MSTNPTTCALCSSTDYEPTPQGIRCNSCGATTLDSSKHPPSPGLDVDTTRLYERELDELDSQESYERMDEELSGRMWS